MWPCFPSATQTFCTLILFFCVTSEVFFPQVYLGQEAGDCLEGSRGAGSWELVRRSLGRNFPVDLVAVPAQCLVVGLDALVR